MSAALGADDAGYRIRGLPTRLYALSRSQRFRVSFSGSVVAVESRQGWLSVRLAGASYASPRVRGNRVTYQHGAVTEWYANGPLGVEQGFGIARPLIGAGRRALRLSLELAGDLHPMLDRGGRQVLFDSAGGRAVLRYGGLMATDANGHPLRAWLSLRGTSLLVRVDTTGARYPLRIDPFIQSAELAASDGADGDQLGDSVATSGATIAVGAPEHTVAGHRGQGAVYVFSEPASGAWQNAYQTAELTASDGAAGDGLGSSVAMSGSTIVTGAPAHGSGGTLYVFSQGPSGHWKNSTQGAELTASDGSAGDGLGSSVALDGATIVGGAPEHTVAGQGGQGAVYAFAEPASGGWRNSTQSAELSASDGVTGDELGYAVSLSSATIAASAPGHAVAGHAGQGAAYAFSEPATGGWRNATQTAELTAADGSTGDGLGDSVSISGPTIAVGSILHSVGANSGQGAVYVFSEPASGGWKNSSQSAALTAADGAPGDALGYAVEVSGGTIVAGAPEHSVAGAASRGAVYIFSQPGEGEWKNAVQTAEVTAAGGAAGDELGYSAGISGGTIVAGAPEHTVVSGGSPGYVYVFATPKPPPPKPTPPALASLRQSHRSWREGNHLATIARRASSRTPVGTTFSFVLNEPARVGFDFTQGVAGRRIGRRCVAKTSTNRRDPPCSRSVTRGVLSFIGHAGTNRVVFDGVVSRSNKLRPGTYALTVIATAADLSAQPRSIGFTILFTPRRAAQSPTLRAGQASR